LTSSTRPSELVNSAAAAANMVGSRAYHAASSAGEKPAETGSGTDPTLSGSTSTSRATFRNRPNGPAHLLAPEAGWAIASLGSSSTAAMSACSFGAAAAVTPSTIVVWVLPSAVRLTIWHPVAP